ENIVLFHLLTNIYHIDWRIWFKFLRPFFSTQNNTYQIIKFKTIEPLYRINLNPFKPIHISIT
ncbi:MAG TPA: hypothetical protein VER14_02730, partial [Phototrophicaceae bacterium]|nr:hypothetical protein [Phototrophicaceae bacterium]